MCCVPVCLPLPLQLLSYCRRMLSWLLFGSFVYLSFLLLQQNTILRLPAHFKTHFFPAHPAAGRERERESETWLRELANLYINKLIIKLLAKVKNSGVGNENKLATAKGNEQPASAVTHFLLLLPSLWWCRTTAIHCSSRCSLAEKVRDKQSDRQKRQAKWRKRKRQGRDAGE